MSSGGHWRQRRLRVRPIVSAPFAHQHGGMTAVVIIRCAAPPTFPCVVLHRQRLSRRAGGKEEGEGLWPPRPPAAGPAAEAAAAALWAQLHACSPHLPFARCLPLAGDRAVPKAAGSYGAGEAGGSAWLSGQEREEICVWMLPRACLLARLLTVWHSGILLLGHSFIPRGGAVQVGHLPGRAPAGGCPGGRPGSQVPSCLRSTRPHVFVGI